MSKSNIVSVKVPKRYGFDKSHHNLLSASVGTLVPILVDEVIPNTKVNCKIAVGVTMPPLVSDTYMKVDYKVEAFFVPLRLLYGGFEDWFADTPYPVISDTTSGGSSISQVTQQTPFMPAIRLTTTNSSALSSFFGPGTLIDYLGYRNTGAQAFALGTNISPLPMLAYHKIWDDWYRAPSIQKSCFARRDVSTNSSTGNSLYYFASLPYMVVDSGNYALAASTAGVYDLADGVSIFNLRQRNFGFDYFVNSFIAPQLGSAITVASSSTFSIASLRAANSLQQFAELNQLAGSRLVDVVKARYGANLSDGVARRSIFLGSASYNVYSHGVSVTANNGSANPFSAEAGGRVANAYASGSDFIISGFTANEPGYIFVIGSLVPVVSYGSGLRRYLRRYCNGAGSLAEMATPLLQNTGNQPIYQYEISNTPSTFSDVFGYTDRYADFMGMEDEIHGLFNDGSSLSSFALKRTFTGPTTISSSFLEIPTTYMDEVTIVSAALSNYGYWADMHFDYKVSQPLAPYSIPSLQNPAYEHGKEFHIRRGGLRF